MYKKKQYYFRKILYVNNNLYSIILPNIRNIKWGKVSGNISLHV